MGSGEANMTASELYVCQTCGNVFVYKGQRDILVHKPYMPCVFCVRSGFGNGSWTYPVLKQWKTRCESR